MKILTIMTTRFDLNGITKVVKNNYYYLDKNQFKVDFVIPNKPDDQFSLEVEKHNGSIFIIPNRMRKPIGYIKQLMKIMKNNRYDIVHVHGNSNTLAIETVIAFINKVSARLAHIHSTKTKFPLINLLLKLPFKLTCTGGIAVSKEAGEWMFGNDYTLISNGIEVETFKFNEEIRITKRKQLGFNEEHKVIGNVGRFSEEKNQVYLIDLLEELLKMDLQYRLLLVGDGKLHDEYIRLVKTKNMEDKVVFAGNQTDVSSYLFAMDIMVVPSIFEGLGLSLLEGQASDLLCYASNNVPFETNITSSMEYFNLADMRSLVESISNEFKNNPLDRNRHGLYNIVLRSKYNIKKSVEELENRYRLASSN